MIIDAVASRHSIRNFNKAPVDRALIDEILAAGRLAPSAANWPANTAEKE